MHQRKGKKLIRQFQEEFCDFHNVFLFAKVGNKALIDHAKNKITELAFLNYFSPNVQIK